MKDDKDDKDDNHDPPVLMVDTQFVTLIMAAELIASGFICVIYHFPVLIPILLFLWLTFN